MSPQELWADLQDQLDTHTGIPEDGTRVCRTIEAKPAPGQLVADLGQVTAEVVELRFDVMVWFELETVPLFRVYSYRSDETRFLETIEYVIDLEDHQEIIGYHRNLRDGSHWITRRLPENGASKEVGLWIRIKDEQRP